MIHYHGTPITPATTCRAAIAAGHAFVSYAEPRDLPTVLECCQSFAVDNGAFSAWKSGKPILNWKFYYEFIASLHRTPSFDFAVIPDVIDGTEAENDALMRDWPWQEAKSKWIGSPVWHLHESLARLERLANEWPRVCLGSSGEFAVVGSPQWWHRMAQAMAVLIDREGMPICKLHGLRMLNPAIFSAFPFASADSTNIARNVGIDQAWRGTYAPPNKDVRAQVMRSRIEAFNSPYFYTPREDQGRSARLAAVQQDFFVEAAADVMEAA